MDVKERDISKAISAQSYCNSNFTLKNKLLQMIPRFKIVGICVCGGIWFPVVQVLSGLELIFFLAAGAVLCFRLSVRITLIPHGCLCCCYVVLMLG